jgi:hypothetical protein
MAAVNDSPSSLPQRTEGEEFVHSLRNILAAMTYGTEALDGAARIGSDEREFKTIQAAMKKQLERLRDAVAEAVRLLEPSAPVSLST